MITIRNAVFEAPLDATYAAQLIAAGWYKNDQCYYTREVNNVVPVLGYLSPETLALVTGQPSGYSASERLEPEGRYDIKVPEGLKLHGFQSVAVEYILDRHTTLLAEDPGTGKSAIIACVANTLDCKNVLIVCPAIAKYNWERREWRKWTTLHHLKVGVVEGNNYPKDADVVIINYDILDRHKCELNAKVWDLLVFDESHRLTGRESKRTLMSLGGYLKLKGDKTAEDFCAQTHGDKYAKLSAIPSHKRIFASATPMNRPRDLWTIIKAGDPKGLGASLDEYEKRYCNKKLNAFGWDNSGAGNLVELGGRLRCSFMVRHDPKKILNLTPFRQELFLLPPVKLASQENDFLRDNMKAILSLLGDDAPPPDANPDRFFRAIGEAISANADLIGDPEFTPLFQNMATLRKETGIAKIPHIAEFIKMISDDLLIPTVVFGYHREVLKGLKEIFPKSSLVFGGMSTKKRDDEVVKFQEGENNLFLGNIDSASESITLTRSALVVVAEPDWRATALTQAIRRVYRITQTQDCVAYFLAAAKSMDAILTESSFERLEDFAETFSI